MRESTVSDSVPLRSDRGTVRQTIARLRKDLLSQRTDEGHWVGELSPSALSTATAVSAMAAVLIHSSSFHEDKPDQEADRSPAGERLVRLRRCVQSGLDYLRRQQNPDGGYGDTDRSHSNIATSYLVLAAAALAQRATEESLPEPQLERLNQYIRDCGELDALRQRYGTDKTFVVPILTNLAIAGLVPWSQVPRLPFEAAVFPQSVYRFLRMPVVSYAIPALVAIGQARHFCGSRALLPIHAIRAASVKRTMRVLRRMQPESGGYLEATPLTSFVVMSLAATQRINNDVCRHGLRFLEESMTEDGSWPIDTNLATWVTSLSIEALTSDPEDDGAWCDEALVRWHLDCQHRERHPFTGAEPGGWGWSDLSGAVPDSDDTPAAILALNECRRWIRPEHKLRDELDRAVTDGAGWLFRLQNRDGGWPTFCRGWGKLPFDRSSNDLTAHAIRALDSIATASARSDSGEASASDDPQHRSKTPLTDREPNDFAESPACRRAVRFLLKGQRSDGSWLPLWFGNQDREDESNPVYGTAKVLATVPTGVLPRVAIDRGREFLLRTQNADGGWGGGGSVTKWLQDQNRPSNTPQAADSPSHVVVSSMEDTALAVDALVSIGLDDLKTGRNRWNAAGVQTVPNPQIRGAAPISPDPEQASDVYPAYREAIIRGVEFLVAGVDQDRHRVPWPIGFYFAKLWYHEKLYPLIFTLSALGKYDSLANWHGDAGWPR